MSQSPVEVKREKEEWRSDLSESPAPSVQTRGPWIPPGDGKSGGAGFTLFNLPHSRDYAGRRQTERDTHRYGGYAAVVLAVTRQVGDWPWAGPLAVDLHQVAAWASTQPAQEHPMTPEEAMELVRAQAVPEHMPVALADGAHRLVYAAFAAKEVRERHIRQVPW